MLLQSFKVSGHHLPCIGLQAGLLVELAVEVRVVLQFLNLSQQGAVVTIWIPEEDGVVVQHIWFRVVVRSPVDRDASRAYSVEYLFSDIALDGGVLGADVELILLEELGFVVVVFRLQLVGVVEEFSCAVDGGDGVEALDQSCTPLGSRIVGTTITRYQRTEAVAQGGVPFLVAQLVANTLNVLLGRFRREHLQYPQRETHVSRVVGIVKAETEVDGFMVKEVVQVGGEAGVVVVLAVEIETFVVMRTRMS